MSVSRISFLIYVLSLTLSGVLVFSAVASAQTYFSAPFSAQASSAVSAESDESRTVIGIVIDKTDKNAVLARDQAIVEAQRVAFQKLAERSMTSEEFRYYESPDDEMIAMLVQDFEIKNEQISANRYVASFTVRFNPEIANYIKIPAGALAVVASDTPLLLPVVIGAEESRIVLILPYFEDISGKKLLWEDPNPWREAWQAIGNSSSSKMLVITVPLGDIADISSGNTDAVWSGDYSVVEKMRVNYGATEVALALANKSGVNIRSDLYIYKNGKFDRKNSVAPYTSGQNDWVSFRRTVEQMIHAIRASEPFPAPVSPSNTVKIQPEKITFEAVVNFVSFAQWLDVQNRLSSILPTPVVEISGISKTSARIAIGFDGNLGVLRRALEVKGFVLNEPVIAVFAGDAPKPPLLYELKLMN
ncbi:MAG: DUF2066 domain-containing protein [Alphaproteobacteria bacterium]|nr:DUF2066 domain-containing protein [Alphaproteobacteria bacterium]